MKKLILILVVALCSFFIYKTTVSADPIFPMKDAQKTPIPRLTDKQRQLLHEKKIELRQKYFENWKDKTDDEKMKAVQDYKTELEQFCKDKLGISYDQLRRGFHRCKCLPY